MYPELAGWHKYEQPTRKTLFFFINTSSNMAERDHVTWLINRIK